MIAVPYDPSFQPAAPIVEATIRNPNVAGPSIDLRLIVDSGAEQTVIPDAVIQTLGVPRDGWVQVSGYSGAGLLLGEHTVELTIQGQMAVVIRVLAIGADGHFVVGRDVLNRYRVVLDGPRQTLEIG
jgi:hypothetical protein